MSARCSNAILTTNQDIAAQDAVVGIAQELGAMLHACGLTD